MKYTILYYRLYYFNKNNYNFSREETVANF